MRAAGLLILILIAILVASVLRVNAAVWAGVLLASAVLALFGVLALTRERRGRP